MVPDFQYNPIGACFVPYVTPSYQAVSTTGFRIDASTDGVAYFFNCDVAEKLTDVYVFITATAGTPPTLTCELFAATGTSTIGSAVSLYSTTVAGRSSVGWVKFSFSNASRAALDLNNGYFLKITSTGDASNYNDVATAFSQVTSASYTHWASFTTTNSFSAITLVNRNGTPLVVTYETVTAGHPYTKAVQPTTNSDPKGVYIPATDGQLILCGMFLSSAPGISTLYVYRSGSGSADHTISVNAGLTGLIRHAPITLDANQDYRYVFNYTSTNVRPGYLEIEDPDDFPALLLARFGGGWHLTAYESSAWVDYPKRFPCLSVRLAGFAAGSGGSSRPLSPFHSQVIG